MTDFSDKTEKIRQGEEFNAEAVEKYLTKQVPELQGKMEVEQFPAGHSNLTYMIRFGEKELVLRRPPFGSKVKSAHDMGREYKVLSAINEVYSPAPRPYAYCEDESIIGAKFYVMERKKGIILRRQTPDGMDFPPETVSALCQSFIKNLAKIHSIDYEAVGLAGLGKPDGYLYRQVHGWAERYAGSQTDEIKEIDGVIAWLKDNLPGSPAPSLIHNDYKYDNIILGSDDITKIVGVLDWEMSTIGDPLSDLGVAVGYWVQANDPPELLMSSFGPTHVKGSYTRQQLIELYGKVTGRDVSNMHYYIVFAMFKTAVIIQQIYYRFAKGHTKDDRFGPMIEYVRLLSRVGAELIERGKFE